MTRAMIAQLSGARKECGVTVACKCDRRRLYQATGLCAIDQESESDLNGLTSSMRGKIA